MTIPGSGPKHQRSSTGHDLASAAWLDLHFLAMQPEYEEMLRWVGIQQNWHALDAACGVGSFVPLMTELVGKGGSVSAIDVAPENVRVLEARAKQNQWPAPVSAHVGSILDLPYGSRSFDAVWCANTTQYLTDDELRIALREFGRVVRSGGLIAIKEFDTTTLQFQPTPRTLVSHLVDAMHRAGNLQVRGGTRTIQLSAWLREAGFTNVQQKPTLMVRLQPLRPVEKKFVCDLLGFWYTLARTTDLPREELEVWEELADVNSSNHITSHPDFQYRAIQTVFVGRVP